MKALITVGCKTDHGGIIVLGDSSFLVEGKAVHLDGIVKLLYYSYKIRKKLEITHRLSRSTILYAYV